MQYRYFATTPQIDAITRALDLVSATARGAMAVIAENGPSPNEERVSHGLETSIRELEEALQPVLQGRPVKGGAV